MGDRPRRRRRPHLDPGAPTRPPLTTLDGPAAARVSGTDGWESGAAPADLAVLEQLATAPVKGMGRVVYSSNAVFLLELDAPDPRSEGQPMRAVYKPARGERPLWDFPRRTLHRRERAAYVAAVALRMPMIPPTVIRDGPHGEGSVQLFVDPGAEQLDQRHAESVEAQLRRLAVLDVLLNNADRKQAHLLIDAELRLWGIDNALTFLPYPRQRTVLIDLGGEKLAEDDAELVRAFAADGERRETADTALSPLLTAGERRAFLARVEELAEDPVYPELDPWDGRPFEWW